MHRAQRLERVFADGFANFQLFRASLGSTFDTGEGPLSSGLLPSAGRFLKTRHPFPDVGYLAADGSRWQIGAVTPGAQETLNGPRVLLFYGNVMEFHDALTGGSEALDGLTRLAVLASLELIGGFENYARVHPLGLLFTDHVLHQGGAESATEGSVCKALEGSLASPGARHERS